MTQKNDSIQNLKLILHHAWGLRWWLFALQIVVTAGAVASLQVLPRQYRSTTTIRVAGEGVINPLTQGLAVASRMENQLGSLRQEVLSRSHLEAVITRLGLEGPGVEPEKHEKLLGRMASRIVLDIPRSSSRRGQPDVFQLSYTGEDPYEVRDVTNALALSFIEKSLTTKKGETDAAYRFISEQLEIYRKKLEESENALRRFEEQHMDELPETRTANLARLEVLKSSLEEVRHNMRQSRIQKDLLIQRIPGEAAAAASREGEAMVPNPLIEDLQGKEEDLRRLRRDYSDTYPDVVSLRAEIAQLQKEVEAHPTVPAAEVVSTGANTVQQTLLDQVRQLDMEIQTLTTREAQLEKEITQYQKKVQSIPAQEQELSRLRRDYDVDSNIYEMFLRRLEEARVSRELEEAKRGEIFQIIDAATLPLTPFSPVRWKVLLMGIAGGLALNLALVFFVKSRDTSLQDAGEVEDFLKAPVLARIPRVVTARQQTMRRAGYLLFVLLCGLYGAASVVGAYWERVRGLTLEGGWDAGFYWAKIVARISGGG